MEGQMDDDVVMTMDVNQFEKSLHKVLEGFFQVREAVENVSVTGKKIETGLADHQEKIAKHTKETHEKTAKGTSMAYAKGMLIATAAIGAIKGIINTVVENIPEIGKTFQISKDIIMRNLLGPLRKELIPILQSVLNWVRDHRIAFVQAGTVLVSIFRLIKTVVLSFVDIIKDVLRHLATGLEAIFGKTTKNITEILNLILFKISAIVIFIMALLEPVFSWLADKIAIVVGLVTDFAKGFVSTIGDISTNLEDFINIFKDLANTLTLSNDGANKLGKSFKLLGEIVGIAVKPVLTAVATLLEGVVQGIDTMITTVLWAKAKLSGDKSGAALILKGGNERMQQRGEQTKRMWEDVGRNTIRGAKTVAGTWNGNEITSTGKVQQAITNNNHNTTQNVSIRIDGSKDPNATAKAISDHLQKQQEKTWQPQ